MDHPVDDGGQLGDGDAEHDEDGAKDLHVGGAPAEVELVNARREDGLEGDQDHPDRGRDERDGVEVDVVLQGGNSIELKIAQKWPPQKHPRGAKSQNEKNACLNCFKQQQKGSKCGPENHPQTA